MFKILFHQNIGEIRMVILVYEKGEVRKIYIKELARVKGWQMKDICHTHYFFFKVLTLWVDSFYKSKCPCVCSCVCLYVCPCVCVYVHFWGTNSKSCYPFSQSRISKFLRHLESWGTSNGKKWFQIWKLLLTKGGK